MLFRSYGWNAASAMGGGNIAGAALNAMGAYGSLPGGSPGGAWSNATTGSISAGQLAQEASALGTSASSVAADLAAQGFSASQIANVLGSGASPLTDYNSAQELANNATSQFGQAQVPTSFETDYGGFATPQSYNAPGIGGMGTASPIDGMNYQEAQSPVSLNSLYGTQQDRKSTRLNSSHSQQSRMPSSA